MRRTVPIVIPVVRTSRYCRAAVLATVLVLAACGGGGEAEPSDSAVTGCPAADPADATAITDARAALLIGLSEADSERCATELGWGWRVGERDGESFALTADYSPTRITVTVVDGAVTAVVVG
jgi:hypothetical protein